MRDLLLEVLVGLGLTLLGFAVVYIVAPERALGMDLYLAYGLGALVFSVPAIVIIEVRRRRRL